MHDEAAPPPPTTIDLTTTVYKPTEEETAAQEQYIATHTEHAHVQPGKVLRFLRARTLDVKATHQLLTNHLIWENKWKPNAIALTDVDTKAMDSGCWRYLGRSEEGVPTVWVQVAKWNPHEYDKDSYEIYLSYFTSNLERQMTQVTRQIIIFDMEGWALWHAGYMQYIRRLIDIAQNQYPERLRRVVMVNAPFLFRASWVVIKPWMDQVTAEKVVFVAGMEEISEQFKSLSVSTDILPAKFGGKGGLLVPGFPEQEKEGVTEEEEKDGLTF